MQFLVTQNIVMGLLAQGHIGTLKKMPAKLWLKSIESPNPVSYIFDIIGSVKHFDEEKVRLYLVIYSLKRFIFMKRIC